VAEAQLLKAVASRPRCSPGRGRGCRRRCADPAEWTNGVRPLRRRQVGARTILIAMSLAMASAAFGAGAETTCLRPKWTECVSFPNGGRHTGISPYGKPIALDVPPGAKICVTTQWEIRGGGLRPVRARRPLLAGSRLGGGGRDVLLLPKLADRRSEAEPR
jgi:hypothetical protein